MVLCVGMDFERFCSARLQAGIFASSAGSPEGERYTVQATASTATNEV